MTEPLGPPPIEPLSDIEWSRVERGLWARLDTATSAAPATRRWMPRWIWLAAPAFAAAVIAIIVVGLDGDGGLPADRTPVRVVSNEAASSIALGDAHVTLDPQSAVVMERDGSRAVLERGAAWFAVAPRKDRAPFAVHAGDTTIRVIGTRFRVGRSAEIVTVEVERGVIEIQHHETMLELRAGQRWMSAEPTRTAMVDAAPDDIAAPDEAAEPDVPVDPPVMTGKTKPKATKKPAKPTVKTDPKPTPEVKVDARARFERLAAMEARDPRAAIAGYLELAKGNDAWAELSLFAAGRLAHDRGDPRAKSLLDRYLARYPRGANADDARELLATKRK